jgi:hypothetical protein
VAPRHGERIVYEQHAGAARAPLGVAYRRREPERTILYSVVQNHLQTFLAEARAENPDGHDARLRHARKEKIVGIALSVIRRAISMTGGALAIVNPGFPRDTHEERIYFGLSVGLAAGAAPLVTTGVTLWAQGAVVEQREKKRLSVVVDGLRFEL